MNRNQSKIQYKEKQNKLLIKMDQSEKGSAVAQKELPEEVRHQQPQGEQRAPFKLHRAMLLGIDLTKYPKERTHYLAYALQFGLQLPSKGTMDRIEARNRTKAGLPHNPNASQLPAPIASAMRIRKVDFRLPNKFGPSPRRARMGWGGRFQKKKPTYHPRRAIPNREPISLPKQIVRNKCVKTSPKAKNRAYKSLSAQLISLKAERALFREEIQKFRSTCPKATEKQVPLYFQKKKASQQRRRKEKHELIKANRSALVQIFGDAVFSRGWPISRKEIKLALGIKEEDHDKLVSLNQFLEMTQETADCDSTRTLPPAAKGKVFDLEEEFPSLLGR